MRNLLLILIVLLFSTAIGLIIYKNIKYNNTIEKNNIDNIVDKQLDNIDNKKIKTQTNISNQNRQLLDKNVDNTKIDNSIYEESPKTKKKSKNLNKEKSINNLISGNKTNLKINKKIKTYKIETEQDLQNFLKENIKLRK